MVLAEEDTDVVLFPHQVRELRECREFGTLLHDEGLGRPPAALSEAVIDLAAVCRSFGEVEAGDVLPATDLADLSAAMGQLLETIELLESLPYSS